MITKTTITIMRSRITQLMHENGVLRRQNARLRQLIDLAGVDLDASLPQTDADTAPANGFEGWSGAD